MNDLFEPKSVMVPGEKGEPSKLAVALELSPHANELRQARTLLNWRDTRDINLYLQDFVDGLAHIGSFDLSGMELPISTRHDGTQEVDPVIGILTGHASPTDTIDYIESLLAMKNIPADHGEALQRPMHIFTKIYAEYHEHLAKMAHQRNLEQSDLRYQWKRKMLADQDSELAAADWDDGIGEYYQGYMSEQEERDKRYLPNLMKILGRLSKWVTPVP